MFIAMSTRYFCDLAAGVILLCTGSMTKYYFAFCGFTAKSELCERVMTHSLAMTEDKSRCLAFVFSLGEFKMGPEWRSRLCPAILRCRRHIKTEYKASKY